MRRFVLTCDQCGVTFVAKAAEKRHCPRPCAIAGCHRMNASGGYCKTHRTELLGSGVKFGPYSAKIARVLVMYFEASDRTCDICHLPYGDKAPVADHDHAHCRRRFGCLSCIRGLTHSYCNTLEGLHRVGRLKFAPIGLGRYLAAPPFQAWLEANRDKLPQLRGRLLVG